MHICFIYNEYPEETDNGGIATYQYNMARALYNEKNEITVIASSLENNQDYIEDGIRVIRLKNNVIGTVKEQLDYRNRLFKKIQEINNTNKIDIIETPEMGAEALVCIRKGKIPVLVKLHTSYKLWSELNGQLLDDKMHKEMIKWEIEQLNKADAVISCSNLLKEIVEKDIVRRDISVIPNPINTDLFFPTNKRKASNTILYCGSLEYRKGILVLIKAIPLIIEKLGKEIEFELIGRDSFYNGKSMIELIYENLPIEYHKNIKIRGFVNKEELNIAYNKAKIGVIPSIFDNLPYVALEELLTELPIVISNNTGITELLNKENAAVTFENENYKELAEKVVKLYMNKEKANVLGNNGRELVLNKFSTEKIAKIMINKYNDVIKKSKRGKEL